MQVLESEPGPSAGADSTFNCWAIYPALKLSFSKWLPFTFEVGFDCAGSVSFSLGIRWCLGRYLLLLELLTFKSIYFIVCVYGYVEVEGQFAGVGSSTMLVLRTEYRSPGLAASGFTSEPSHPREVELLSQKMCKLKLRFIDYSPSIKVDDLYKVYWYQYPCVLATAVFKILESIWWVQTGIILYLHFQDY